MTLEAFAKFACASGNGSMRGAFPSGFQDGDATAVPDRQQDSTPPAWYRGLPENIEPKRLSDGTLGYFVRPPRTDDCLAAAIATVLQVPISEVPDPRLDERLASGESADDINRSAWQQLQRWLTARGLRVTVLHKAPTTKRRWIGVVPNPGTFEDHCLVMVGSELLFDPSVIFEHVAGLPERPMQFRIFKADQIRWGLTFQSINQSKGNRT
jgi:hypothetical protein